MSLTVAVGQNCHVAPVKTRRRASAAAPAQRGGDDRDGWRGACPSKDDAEGLHRFGDILQLLLAHRLKGTFPIRFSTGTTGG